MTFLKNTMYHKWFAIIFRGTFSQYCHSVCILDFFSKILLSFSTIENLSILRYVNAILTRHHLVDSTNEIVKGLLERSRALLKKMTERTLTLGEQAREKCMKDGEIDGNFGYRGVFMAALYIKLLNQMCERIDLRQQSLALNL